MQQALRAGVQGRGRNHGHGLTVIAPIAHSHPIADFLPIVRCDHDFWMSQDLPLLRAADSVAVLILEGWRESRGVTRELEFAASLNKLVRHYAG
jgi:hypothetical protein